MPVNKVVIVSGRKIGGMVSCQGCCALSSLIPQNYWCSLGTQKLYTELENVYL